MVIRHKVVGYQNFCKFMEDFDTKDKEIYIMFSGAKLPTGENWCSDCVEGNVFLYLIALLPVSYLIFPAQPVVEEALQKFGDETTNFIYVEVGDRPALV